MLVAVILVKFSHWYAFTLSFFESVRKCFTLLYAFNAAKIQKYAFNLHSAFTQFALNQIATSASMLTAHLSTTAACNGNQPIRQSDLINAALVFLPAQALKMKASHALVSLYCQCPWLQSGPKLSVLRPVIWPAWK